MKLEKEFYNIVVLWNTLEHTFNPLQTLRLVSQMLKMGGLVYIRVPNKETDAEVKKFYEERHLFEFREQWVVRILRRLSFKEVFISRYNPKGKVPYADYLFRKESIV